MAPRVEPGTIAGRDVTLLYDDGQPEGLPWYLLPSGDTLWLVGAHEPMLTEVFEKLPRSPVPCLKACRQIAAQSAFRGSVP